MADFTLTTRNEGNVVIIETSGYLNNVGGDKKTKEGNQWPILL